MLLRLEALENEEDLIISDESSLHHTKYNQSQEDQGDGAHGDKPKYAMFENFPIVNTPAAKGIFSIIYESKYLINLI